MVIDIHNPHQYNLLEIVEDFEDRLDAREALVRFVLEDGARIEGPLGFLDQQVDNQSE